MECLGRYTFLVMNSVILSGGVKMRVEHGMLGKAYISGHDFCHTFRWYCRVPYMSPFGFKLVLPLLNLILASGF